MPLDKDHKNNPVLKAQEVAYTVACDAATASGIVFHANGKVFMMQRPDGTWGFPAGSVEDGETAEAAARRECIEETGFAHQGPLSSIGVFDGFFHAFFADVEPFNHTLNEEHIGAGWFRLDELPNPLHGCSVNVLACLFNAMAGDADESAKNYDINGFFEVQDNPLSKVGVFQYLGKNIPQEKAKGNAGKFFAVYRPAEELADPACIASFRLVPWIIDHTMIGNGTNGTAQIEDKGARGVTGERIWFDPKDDFGTLKGNIKCFSDFLAQSIAAGKTPLSLGYRCVYEFAPGVFNGVPYTYVQRRIRGNHLATVEDGRMGPEVAVMDGSELTFTEKSNMSKKTRDALLKAKVKTVAGVARNRLMAFAMDAEEKMADANTSDEDKGELKEAIDAIAAVAPLLEAVEDLKCAGESDVLTDTTVTGDAAVPVAKAGDADDPDKGGKKPGDDEGKGMDAKEVAAVVDAAVKKAMAGYGRGMDAKDVVNTIAKRDALHKQLSAHIGDFSSVAAAMDAQEVAAYGVEKLEIPARKGHEIEAVEAWLHGRTPAHKLPTAQVGDAAERGKKPSFLQAQLAERS